MAQKWKLLGLLRLKPQTGSPPFLSRSTGQARCKGWGLHKGMPTRRLVHWEPLEEVHCRRRARVLRWEAEDPPPFLTLKCSPWICITLLLSVSVSKAMHGMVLPPHLCSCCSLCLYTLPFHLQLRNALRNFPWLPNSNYSPLPLCSLHLVTTGSYSPPAGVSFV